MRPGDVLALVGRSGAGKWTALNVLMGFVRPTSGSVGVGDADLSEVDLDAWRQIGLGRAGEFQKLRGTIASNVLLGYPGATKAQIREALDRAGGEELALDRPIADDGEGLSAGERRRVLARALLRIEFGGLRPGRADGRPGSGHRSAGGRGGPRGRGRRGRGQPP